MRIKDTLHKLNRIVTVLYKLIPTLIDLIEDLSDDGKRNRSNKK